MELKTASIDNVKILRLYGAFCGRDAHRVRQWLNESELNGWRDVVINLSCVNSLDSTALTTLFNGQQTLRRSNRDLKLCGLSQPVRILFETTRLDRVFEIYPEEKDAIQDLVQLTEEGG